MILSFSSPCERTIWSKALVIITCDFVCRQLTARLQKNENVLIVVQWFSRKWRSFLCFFYQFSNIKMLGRDACVFTS